MKVINYRVSRRSVRGIGVIFPVQYLNSHLLITIFADGEQVERAFNLGLAAVLGKGVYNFGELVSQINLCFLNDITVLSVLTV